MREQVKRTAFPRKLVAKSSFVFVEAMVNELAMGKKAIGRERKAR